MNTTDNFAINEEFPYTSGSSDLQSQRWSVISFEKCESSGLNYSGAIQRMNELEEQRISGLCIVTDEAAARMNA